MRIFTMRHYGLLEKQRQSLTHQKPFPQSVKCPKCKKDTHLMMLIDDEGLIAGQQVDKVKIWPHDCTAIALYLCTYCGEMATDWNQA